jgi:ParB family chromosome partitioning protein
VHEPWNRHSRRLAHADTLARAVKLDMAAAGWSPTVDNYLGRCKRPASSKPCASQGRSSGATIDHLKKLDMARCAHRTHPPPEPEAESGVPSEFWFIGDALQHRF